MEDFLYSSLKTGAFLIGFSAGVAIAAIIFYFGISLVGGVAKAITGKKDK